MIRHRAFATALAHSVDGTDDWQRLLAGFVTLRFVDRWLREGASAAKASDDAMRAVRSAVAAVPLLHATDREPALLNAVLDAAQSARRVGPHAVRPALYAYATALQHRSAWTLAADVYEMIVELSEQPPWEAAADAERDAELVDDALIRAGGCYRIMARHAEAARSYGRARDRALERGDLCRVCVARLGETNLVRDRGNLSDAEAGYRGLIEMLTSLIAHGALPDEAVPMAALRAEVRHELANVLHARERPVEAIEVAREAWGEPAYTKRDRLLVDSASYLRDVGATEAARDASLLVLALAAQGGEPVAGWMATANLLELAVDERDEAAFERHRDTLAGVRQLPPFIEAGYYTYLARGYLTFGSATGGRERALQAARHAGQVAAAHGLHQWVFAAEALVAQAEGSAGTTSTTQSTMDRRAVIPPDRAEVVAGAAADLHAARVAAGV